jgi:hypothetical protein
MILTFDVKKLGNSVLSQITPNKGKFLNPNSSGFRNMRCFCVICGMYGFRVFMSSVQF